MSFRPRFAQMSSMKLLEAYEVMAVARLLKQEGQRIIFTNGCFDILHKGHVTYLEQAKNKEGILFVGINSDASVRLLGKGPHRPINKVEDRVAVLAGLASVDYIVIFDEETPEELIQLISPDILIKGGDYDPEETDPKSKKFIVGSDWVKRQKGKVFVIPFVEGYSTTRLIERIEQEKSSDEEKKS